MSTLKPIGKSTETAVKNLSLCASLFRRCDPPAHDPIQLYLPSFHVQTHVARTCRARFSLESTSVLLRSTRSVRVSERNRNSESSQWRFQRTDITLRSLRFPLLPFLPGRFTQFVSKTPWVNSRGNRVKIERPKKKRCLVNNFICWHKVI